MQFKENWLTVLPYAYKDYFCGLLCCDFNISSHLSFELAREVFNEMIKQNLVGTEKAIIVLLILKPKKIVFFSYILRIKTYEYFDIQSHKIFDFFLNAIEYNENIMKHNKDNSYYQFQCLQIQDKNIGIYKLAINVLGKIKANNYSPIVLFRQYFRLLTKEINSVVRSITIE